MQARRPARTASRGPWTTTRLVAAVVTLAALAVVIVVASTPEPAPERTFSTVEEGGLEWGAIDLLEVDGDDDGTTVSASVELDGEPFPAATGPDDRFVLFQFDRGRFDADEHVDDSAAERVMGIDDDDTIQFAPAPIEGVPASAMPRAGEYAMSLDGSIEYVDIPAGTWELRAYVVDRDGSWDGEVATRAVRVP